MRNHPEANIAFPSTSWTALAQLGRIDGDAYRQALSDLLVRYMPAMRAYLVHQRRCQVDRAEDLLQGFIVSRVLERNLFAHADRQRGRFRNLLLSSLNHHLANVARDERRAKRQPACGPLVALPEHDSLSADSAEPPNIFDAAWARIVIDESLRRMQYECERINRPDLWGLFQTRVVLPAIDGVKPPPYEHLVAQYGFDTPIRATNALVTAKRMFERTLRSVVAEYAVSEEDVDQELCDLKAALALAHHRKHPAV